MALSTRAIGWLYCTSEDHRLRSGLWNLKAKATAKLKQKKELVEEAGSKKIVTSVTCMQFFAMCNGGRCCYVVGKLLEHS